MTINDLRNILDKYNNEDAPVVCYNANGDLVDIFIESINVREQGFYNQQYKQRSYEREYSGGEKAVLITVDPPKRRF